MQAERSREQSATRARNPQGDVLDYRTSQERWAGGVNSGGDMG